MHCGSCSCGRGPSLPRCQSHGCTLRANLSSSQDVVRFARTSVEWGRRPPSSAMPVRPAQCNPEILELPPAILHDSAARGLWNRLLLQVSSQFPSKLAARSAAAAPAASSGSPTIEGGEGAGADADGRLQLFLQWAVANGVSLQPYLSLQAAFRSEQMAVRTCGPSVDA